MVLDCPPSLSLIGVNALVAARLVIPVPPAAGARRLSHLLGSIETVRRRLAPVPGSSAC